MRPQTFEDMVGQSQAKEVVNTLIESAKIKDEPVNHILFSGAAGTGKTSLARITATGIGSELYSVNCCTIRNYKQLANVIDKMNHKDILFLDEIHSLPKKVAEFLYTIMEDFHYFDEDGYQVDTSKITVIGASTEIGFLPGPLKRRFKFIAEFVEYTIEELTEVCYLVCKTRGFKLNKTVAEIIAKTCRGNPSKMVDRTDWVYSYMISHTLEKVNKEKLLEIIALQGVNADGLETKDIKYLQALKEKGALSVDSIASKIGIDAETIKKDIEPFLSKIGLFEIRKGKGRQLTRAGMDYIKSIANLSASS